MKRFALLAALAAVALAVDRAEAHNGLFHRTTQADRWAAWEAAQLPWHGAHFYQDYGRPTAMVLPPTANMQTKWGWGVTNTEVWPNYHQFGRRFPGYANGAGNPVYPTPYWPSHTDQFGIYNVRAPW